MTLQEQIDALPEYPDLSGMTSIEIVTRALEINGQRYRASLARLALARSALLMARPIIEADARMMADITRHAPLDYESQAKHDSTEYDCEKLTAVYDALLKALEEPR